MADKDLKSTYLGYLKILGILGVLTLTMVFIGESGMSELPKALLLLVGSALKATLIMMYFMHLKFEKQNLILTIMIGIFVTSVLMFVVPAYDGGHVLENSLYN